MAVQREGHGSARITILPHKLRCSNGVVVMSSGWKAVGTAAVLDEFNQLGGMAGWRREKTNSDVSINWNGIWSGEWAVNDGISL